MFAPSARALPLWRRSRCGGEAVVDHAGGGVAGDQDVLGDVRPEGGPVRLRALEQRVERLQLLAVGRALRDAQMQRRHQHDLALAVEHVDPAAQLLGRVEDDAGGVDVAGIDVTVHREAGRSPLVRDRVLAVRIEGDIHPLRLDVADVGELARPDLVEHPLTGHDLDHVVARHGHVIGAELARLQRRQHRLVGIVGVHGHLDPGLGGELVEKLLRDVLEPVIDRELPLGLRRGGRDDQRDGNGPQSQISVHVSSSPVE